MLVDHEKNSLGAGYIVEFIHDATENYYEGGTYACRNCNNIKFPLYVLNFFACFTFLCQLIIVPISCLLTKSLCIGSGLYLNVLVICFMMLPLRSNSYLLCEHHCHHHAQLKGIKEKILLGDNPIFILTVFVCSHDYATVVIMFYSFCFNKVPSKTFRTTYGDSCVDPAKNQKLLHPVNQFW